MTKAQLEKDQRPRLPQWDRVEWGDYAFSTERFATLSTEVIPFVLSNYNETGTFPDQVPLDIDWDGFFTYEARGQLRCFAVRLKADDKLLGYAAYLLTHTMHCKSTLHAISDVIYVDPHYRKGYMPIKFMRYCEDRLRDAGVKVLFNVIKHNTIGPILERALKQTLHETTYAKVL